LRSASGQFNRIDLDAGAHGGRDRYASEELTFHRGGSCLDDCWCYRF